MIQELLIKIKNLSTTCIGNTGPQKINPGILSDTRLVPNTSWEIVTID